MNLFLSHVAYVQPHPFSFSSLLFVFFLKKKNNFEAYPFPLPFWAPFLVAFLCCALLLCGCSHAWDTSCYSWKLVSAISPWRLTSGADGYLLDLGCWVKRSSSRNLFFRWFIWTLKPIVFCCLFKGFICWTSGTFSRCRLLNSLLLIWFIFDKKKLFF